MDNFEKEEFWKGLGRLYDATDKLAIASERLLEITQSHERRLDKIEVVQQWLADKERGREKRSDG
jgi:hypothetical protein